MVKTVNLMVHIFSTIKEYCFKNNSVLWKHTHRTGGEKCKYTTVRFFILRVRFCTVTREWYTVESKQIS